MAAFFGLALVSASGAEGQMPSSISVEGERVGAASGAEAVYRIQVSAGPGGAAFGLAYDLPRWPTQNAVLGSPITITAVRLNGPGVIRPALFKYVPKRGREIIEACQRGQYGFPFRTSYWVELPADSAAQIELVGRATYPAWPGTSYETAFSTFEVDYSTAPRTPLKAVSVKRLGKRGTHITMHARGVERAAEGSPRSTPEIIGRTDPPLKNARIALRAVQPELGKRVSLSTWARPSPASVPLGSVLTDQQGRFRLLPQPFPYGVGYAIVARSQAKGKLVADWNCGVFF